MPVARVRLLPLSPISGHLVYTTGEARSRLKADAREKRESSFSMHIVNIFAVR